MGHARVYGSMILALAGLCLHLGCGDAVEPGRRGSGDGDGDASGAGGVSGGGGQIGTGGVGGGGGVVGSGATGGIDGCANVDVRPMATLAPGNLLVVFDRSLSMSSPFGGTTRLDAAGVGLIGALLPYTCSAPTNPDGTPCTDNLTVAALLFPSGSIGCDPILPLSDPVQINWQKSTDFVAAWDQYWMTNGLMFGTPIQPAFTQGAVEITAAQAVLPGNFAVLFLTDGAGTCGEKSPPPEVSTWQAMGIPTYVVNVGGGNGTTYNDGVAAAGGTGMSINPSDQAALDAAMQMVLQATARVESCDLKLQGVISDPDGACAGGEVILGTRELSCDDTDGYVIRDASTIELVGPACDELMNGALLDAVFPCEVVAPQ